MGSHPGTGSRSFGNSAVRTSIPGNRSAPSVRPSPRSLWLIKLWLKAPVEERDGDGKRRMSGGSISTRGTPQGGVASPLLANNYADDFVILSQRYAAEAFALQ